MSNREQRMEVILSTIGDRQTSIDGIKAACFEKGIDGPEFDLLLETLRSRNLVYSPKLGKVARVERTD